MAKDDPLHSRCAVAVVGIGVEDHRLVGVPALQAERTRARAVRLQPLVAEIPVHFVGEHELLVDDRRDTGRERVQHEDGGEVLDDGDANVPVVDDFDQAVDVGFVPSELGDDERRCLLELDDAFERELDVLGAHRIAGVEREAVADPEGDGLAVFTDHVALGDSSYQLRQVFRLEHHDPIVEVGDDFSGGELEDFGRIHGDDVREVLGDHERVLGRGGLGWRGEREGNCAQRDGKRTHDSMHGTTSFPFGSGERVSTLCALCNRRYQTRAWSSRYGCCGRCLPRGPQTSPIRVRSREFVT